MVGLLRTRLGTNVALLAGAAVVPAAAMHLLSSDEPAPISGTAHLAIMAVGSAVAAVASAALMHAGARGRDPRAVIVGAAFAAITILLAAHGLATPGVLLGPNGLIGLAGGAALPVGGALLTLAAIPTLRRPEHLPRVAGGLTLLLAALTCACAAGLLWPAVVPAAPKTDSTLARILVGVGLALFLVVASRAARTFTLTRRLADLVVAVGVTWLGVGLVPALLLDPGTWAWWMGHILELSGVALAGTPVALDVYRGRPSHPLVGDLGAAQLVAEEEAFLGARVHALVTRLEHKDRSTEEHTRRVALLAVEIGERLGLAPGRLRELALGGLLHDVGKLAVPDEILKRPAALTDEEFAVIRRHPVQGDELLAELGYDARVRRMVRGHHERLDGSGYPDGLAGDQLDLETRILAVADVWDALVSPRVYRDAWSPERALALLRKDAGIAFDARCVTALESLVGATPPLAHAA